MEVEYKVTKKTETETEDAGNHHRSSLKVDMAELKYITVFSV